MSRIPLLAKSAGRRQSHTLFAGKPVPSSHEPPCQWNLVPVILITSGKIRGEGWGKFLIQSLIEASGCQENAVLAHGADASKADCT